VDLATAADIRLCTDDATFSVAETKLAIVADLGTLQRIEAVANRGLAREMVFTGESVNAEMAVRSGLVNRSFKTKVRGRRNVAIFFSFC
jgi:enoyl-CoA hydratase/carnithine racemase